MRAAAAGAVARAAAPPARAQRRTEVAVPDEVGAELTAAVGGARGEQLRSRMADAADAFRRERFLDARRMLKALTQDAPDAPSVRELYGLTLYRLGRWREAAHQLEAFRALTGSTEQHPVLADCYRALGRHTEVAELWDELRASSPGAEVVTEGRIVMAGSLADRGQLAEAIALLEKAEKRVRRPRPDHLRLWYALGALYEQVGDVPRAKERFARVAAADPEFADVGARLVALG